MEETLSSTNTYTKQQWIAEQARVHPERVFTSLHHLIDSEWMREAYRRTRKDGATGIDGVSADDFEVDLEGNLESLLERMKSGSYRAPPVRRHYIPKADGSRRPLGILTFEDKVAQRAILMLLEPIYESDFLPCSYGFRRGRSAHHALHALRTGIMERHLRWVIDADLSNYFGSISHTHLRGFLDLRITDGVVRRRIDKWLKAGVLEEGVLRRSETGTPQGGVISPALSERSRNVGNCERATDAPRTRHASYILSRTSVSLGRGTFSVASPSGSGEKTSVGESAGISVATRSRSGVGVQDARVS